ncbi:MAG: hypothetical protein Q7W51_11570 [Coriobacteriia bacterium]|nr:hypothetical protein [Coriobacteriia bacterium]
MHPRVPRLAVAVLFVIACGLSSVAYAEEASPSTGTSATAPYELDFTLPSESRSGCMVCHGDPALIRVREGAAVSFYVNEEAMGASTHGDQQCVGCHIDFTFTAPHSATDWPTTAKTACRNCHDEQSRLFSTGVHRPTVDSEAQASEETSVGPRPLCGDCHGGHDIMALTEAGGEDFKKGTAAIHDQGFEVCGRCHEDYWDSYHDYYHGAAYKLGAEDAPACWDCHGWHDIQPSDNRDSLVNEAHLIETCGQDGCHSNVDEKYVEYAEFIHTREQVKEDNPIHSLFRAITDALGRLFGGGDDS